MVGAAFDHFCDMFCLLVDGHGPDDAAMWRRGGQFDLDWTGLGNLTVELLQQRRVLGRKRTHTHTRRDKAPMKGLYAWDILRVSLPVTDMKV